MSAPAIGTTGASASPTSGWDRRRGTVAVVLAVLAALAVVVLVGGGPDSTTPLDPDNPGDDGARAVARVLAERGVAVEVVRDAAGLQATALDGDTTVVVTSPQWLGRSTARGLREHLDGARLVVVGADVGATEALGVAVAPRQVSLDGPLRARCTDTGLAPVDGLVLEVDTALAYPTSTGCFPHDAGWLLAPGGERTVLLGAADLLTNGEVLRGDNAAIALRLLGQEERLVWYVPDPADLTGDDGVALGTLLPDWLVPALWLVGVATVALVWWRGRRLGALAVEPLPVVVRAVETTEGRGLLYRRSGDRGHAARVLRHSTRDALARRLRLPPDDETALVAEVARRVRRPAADVAALLGGDAPPPSTDADLVHLATALAELDTEVRRP